MDGGSAQRARAFDAQDLFERLFEFSPDAILVVDRAGRISQANAQVEKLFCYSRTELLGQPVEVLIPDRFREAHLGHRKDYNDQPRTRPMGANLELYGRRKDGSEFPVDIMLSPVETIEGPYVLSAIRDASERKGAEEALRLSEQRFRSLVDCVRDYAIFQMDVEGRVQTWNAGAELVKGYRADEIVGRHFSCFYTGEDVAQEKPRLELKAAAERGRYEDEGWRVRKDGSRFWANVVITAIRDQSGKLVGFAKVIRDVSDRKNAEEALRLSEQHSRMLFELSPDAIIVSNREGRITEANRRVESLFGYSRGELLGQSVEVLIPERFRHVHPKHRAEYDSQPRMRSMGVGLELYGLRKDGSEFPVDIMLGPAKTQNGRVILSDIRDLSERRRYEGALRRSEEEKRYLEQELSLEHQFGKIIGESAALRRVLEQLETVAGTDATVLLLGETGTGKDLVARALHQLSSRRERTLVKLNCAAIPTGLLESELFGHEKGAFTGAISQKIGRLELAHQGTLFLDEIGDLPLELQPKILRALQEKEFERLGGTRTIPVDVRLIAATNRDLAKMVADRQFRIDLYYRLKVFPIVLPPLRERREDIPLLVRHFLEKHSRQMHKVIENIPSDIMQALVRRGWPGNIRELENLVERAVILTKGPTLRIPLADLEMAEEPALETDPTLKDVEREHILRALREARGTVGGPRGAANRLGLKRTTLNSKLKKLGIDPKDFA